MRSWVGTWRFGSMRASKVLIVLAASCAASALAAFLVVGYWLIAVAAPYGFRDLITADAARAFIYIGGFAALTTLACAMPLSAVLFLAHRPLLKLLNGSFFRHIIAGAAMTAFSVAIMRSVRFPPDPSDFNLAVLIACLAGPAASAVFWFSTRSGNASSGPLHLGPLRVACCREPRSGKRTLTRARPTRPKRTLLPTE